MKSFNTMLASIAVFAALLFSASVANAAAIDNPVPEVNNGVTCIQRINGTYPEDGHYYYCGTNQTNKITFVNAIHTVFNAYPAVGTALQGNNASFYVFSNAVDTANFTSSGTPTQQQLMNFYASNVNVTGFTTPAGGPAVTYIFENMSTGTYPNTTPIANGLILHTILHEMGHAFDNAKGEPSVGGDYNLVVQKDQLFMTGNAVSPSAATLRSTYAYALNPTANNPPTPPWSELFAEEFANYVETNQPGIGASSLNVDSAAINPYFRCSSLFVSKEITANREPTTAEYASTGCTVQCVVYPSPLGTSYPKTGHMYNCMGTPRNGPETTLQNNIMASLNGVITTYKGDLAKLSAKNVDFYVFYDPIDAYITKGLGGSPSATEIALSYLDPPVGNSSLPNASSILYVYNQTEWAALYPTIPSSINSTRFSGSASHELGHQMDRIWAQGLGYAPVDTARISSNTTNQAYYLSALAWDYAAMSPTDQATLWTTYPYLMIDSTHIDDYQMFGEQKANSPGVGLGGTTGKSFLAAKLTCSTWLVNQLSSNNGAFPAAPLAAQCHNHTSW